MKRIEFGAGQGLDAAYQDLQKNAPCYGEFNGRTLYSTDGLDDIYINITRKTKQEFDEYLHQEREDYERKEAEFKACIPKLTEEYRERARGIIPQEHLEFWDKIIPIRLQDLYHGMELDCWLDLIAVLNDESKSKEDRMKEGLQMFINQGHSGMSAGLVLSSLCRFHALGRELAEYIQNN